jgi:ABC-type lipoprotein export system ATPase subunit
MLEVIDLFKSYSVKKGPEVVALNHVSLTFPETGLVFILGRSGAGKSTFLNVLGGLEKADGGEIRIEGKSSKDFSSADYDAYRNTYLGFVFQEYNLLSEYSVKGNLELALSLQGKESDPSLISQALAEVDLSGYEERKVNALSGGQRQRVAIARALIKNPKVILADEPTGALDSESSLEILHLLKRLSEEKLVIVVTHDQEFAQEFGDRIITFKDGKITEDKIIHETKKSLQNPTGLQWQKAHLRFSNSLKMALSSCVSKPVKLVISILLTSIAFTFLGVSASAARFDAEASGMKALKYTNNNFVQMRKGYDTYDAEQKRYSSLSMPLGKKDLEALDSKTGLHFEGRTANQEIPLHNNYAGDASHTYIYYPKEAVDVYPVDALPSDFPLVSGRLPQAQGEACITLRELEAFEHFGYQIYDLVTDKEIVTPASEINAQSILGKVLTGHSNSLTSYTIVGVVDTHFDGTPYASLKALDDAGSATIAGSDVYLSGALTTRNESSFDTVLFTLRRAESSYQRNNRFYLNRLDSFATLKDEATQRYAGFDCGHEFVQDQPFVFANGKSSLAFNEVLVSDFDFAKFLSEDPLTLSSALSSKYSAIVTEGNRLYGTSLRPAPYGEDPTSVQDLFGTFRAFETLAFAQQHLAEATSANFPFARFGAPAEKATSDDNLRAFQSFVWTHCLAPEPTSDVELITPWRQAFVSFFNQEIATALAGYESTLFQGGKAALTIGDSISTSVAFTDIRVVGFYVPTGDFIGDNFDTGSLVISDELAAAYLPYRFAYFDSAVAYLSSDEGKIRQVVASFMEDREHPSIGEGYAINSAPLGTVYNAKQTSRGYGIVFLWVGSILLFFAILLFANLIATSINARQKEIGILRALGARSLDIYGIYGFESVIVAFACALFSSVATFVACALINRAFMSVTLPVAYFNPDALVVLLLFGSALLTAFVASFIPAFRTAKKPPVEAIRSL